MDTGADLRIGTFVRIVGPCRYETDLDLRGKLGRIIRDDVDRHRLPAHYRVTTRPAVNTWDQLETSFWDDFCSGDLEIVDPASLPEDELAPWLESMITA